VPGGVGLTSGRAAVAAASCVGLAFAGALAARIAASAGALAGSVSESRRRGALERAPLWQRLYLDLGALAASGLVYWLTVRTGFSAVVNPDSNPTLSLSVYMFFAPALLWIGATLLLVRLRGRLVAVLARRGAGRRRARRADSCLPAPEGEAPRSTAGSCSSGCYFAFGVNLGLFTATYDQQARIDAQLTLGADVVATAPAGAIATNGLSATIAAVPGVTSVSAVGPLLCLCRAGPAGHLRRRPGHDRQGHEASRLLLLRRERRADSRPAFLDR